MTASTQAHRKAWARVVAKAWADEEYKRRLLVDPAAIAWEENLPLPDGLTLKVIEDVPGTRTLVLPPPPARLDADVEVDERLAASDDQGESDPVGMHYIYT